MCSDGGDDSGGGMSAEEGLAMEDWEERQVLDGWLLSVLDISVHSLKVRYKKGLNNNEVLCSDGEVVVGACQQ